MPGGGQTERRRVDRSGIVERYHRPRGASSGRPALAAAIVAPGGDSLTLVGVLPRQAGVAGPGCPAVSDSGPSAAMALTTTAEQLPLSALTPLLPPATAPRLAGQVHVRKPASGEVRWSHRDFVGDARAITVSGLTQTGGLAAEDDPDIRYRGAVSLQQPRLLRSHLSGFVSPLIECREDRRDRSLEIGSNLTLVIRPRAQLIWPNTWHFGLGFEFIPWTRLGTRSRRAPRCPARGQRDLLGRRRRPGTRPAPGSRSRGPCRFAVAVLGRGTASAGASGAAGCPGALPIRRGGYRTSSSGNAACRVSG
jgi:hypothetical protein